MESNILVTGGTGFIGAHLVKKLADEAANVYVLNPAKVKTIRLDLAGVPKSVHIATGDICNRKSVMNLLKKSRPQTVYHLAGSGIRAKEKDFSAIARVNVLGAVNLLDACAEYGVRRLVWMGSGFEYSKNISKPIDENCSIEPATWYGATKVASWQLARYFNRETMLGLVTLRLFSAYGPMEHPSRFIPYVITTLIEGKSVEMTSGEQQRDYLYVDDIVNALILLGKKPGIDGEVYNLGSGSSMPVKEIAIMISDLLGARSKLKIGALQRQRKESNRMMANTAKIEKLGWKPRTDLRRGLEKTIIWFKENRSIWKKLP
jgi:nucleoside-diphosphate-sugar epimerase